MFGFTSERSIQNNTTNGIACGVFDESSMNDLQQQNLLSTNILLSHALTGLTTTHGTAAHQDQQPMSFDTAKASHFCPATAISSCTQGSSPYSARASKVTSCALYRWISTQSSVSNCADKFVATATAMNHPPSTSSIPEQVPSQQLDAEPLPLTSISYSSSSNDHQLDENFNDVATMMMMTMPELLLEGERPQHVPTDMNPWLNATSTGAQIVSDNDIDNSSTGDRLFARNKSARFRRDQAEQWSERYDELISFLEEHGHCRVPRNHKKYGNLSSWVKRQRYQYKLRKEGKPSFLTDERVAALDQLGFVWDSHSSVWETRFRELQEFRHQVGHTNVPYNYKNAKLASWVKAQRREMLAFKEGKIVSSEMFQRFIELEKLDFCWQMRTSKCNNQSREARHRKHY